MQYKLFLHFSSLIILFQISLLVYSAIRFNLLKSEAPKKTSEPLNHTDSMSPLYLGPEKPLLVASLYEGGHKHFNPLICPDGGANLKLLILVLSATDHQSERLAIRLTWGHFNIRRDVSLAFFIGRSRSSIIEKQLNEEGRLYSDLIQGNSIDSYYNLTLKTVSLLEWVDRHCSKASFILKTDDDVFINVPRLLKFINENSLQRRVIFGDTKGARAPHRRVASKYYVSRAQYPKNSFPKYALGPAYLMSSDIIHDVYVKSLEQRFMKLEDVFVTGIVARLLNLKRIHVSKFLDKTGTPSVCNVQSKIGIILQNSSEQFRAWGMLFQKSSKCKSNILQMIRIGRM